MLSFFSHLVLNPLGILLRYLEAVVQKCSAKKVFLNSLQNSEESNCAGVSFSTKLQADYCKKEITAHVFSSKISNIFKSTFLKNIPGWLILNMKFFQAIFYTYSRNIWSFSRKIYFCNNQPLLLLLPGFRKPWSQGMLINLVSGRNSDYIDKIFMQAFKH